MAEICEGQEPQSLTDLNGDPSVAGPAGHHRPEPRQVTCEFDYPSRIAASTTGFEDAATKLDFQIAQLTASGRRRR